jgi:hypothetical protein
MIEAGAPSTGGVAVRRCARHTGGSHGRTTDARAQRRGGAKRRAAPDRSKGAAKGIIKAGTPIRTRTVTQIVDALLLTRLHGRACCFHHFTHDFPPLP